jgi:hypothetical protein
MVKLNTMNILNWFKKEKNYELTAYDVFKFGDGTRSLAEETQKRIELLEKHLNLEYFHGDKNKPHYRTKRKREKIIRDRKEI